MEFTKSEVKLVLEVSTKANELAQKELSELLLATAGGGFGDVVFG